MKEQLVNVPASGNAPVAISASTFSTFVQIVEDGSAAAAGLKAYFPDDNFTQAYEFPYEQQPITRGPQQVTARPLSGVLLGKPDRTVPTVNGNGGYTNIDEPATIYCKLVSMGAATVVRVVEGP